MKLRWIVVAALAAVTGIAIMSYGAYRFEPAFYADALAAQSTDQSVANNELLEHASALTADAQHDRSWKALFSARQINGWLAIDVPKNHPDLLPIGITAPRVAIDRGRLSLAFRYGHGRLSAVCSVDLAVSMAAPDLLAIRVDNFRAGLIPIPMGRILDAISQQARRAGVAIEWKQSDGNPVALVRMSPFENRDQRFFVRSIEMHDGEMYVTGQTEPVRVARLPAGLH
ncbi:MAG: hypothetical protein K1X71_08795 [Pirellulales bacterium]|nr:hypothetical protein [Pirellulales bacterium]